MHPPLLSSSTQSSGDFTENPFMQTQCKCVVVADRERPANGENIAWSPRLDIYGFPILQAFKPKMLLGKTGDVKEADCDHCWISRGVSELLLIIFVDEIGVEKVTA